MASPQKRAAAAGAAEVKRARLSESLSRKCTDLATELVKNPVVARSLVLSFLERSLAVEPEQRQGKQEELVEVVGDVVGCMDAWKKEAVEDAQAEVDRFASDIAALEATSAAREAEASTAQAGHVERAAALEAAEVALAAAKAAVKKLQAEHKVEDEFGELLVKEMDGASACLVGLELLRDHAPCERAQKAKFLRELQAVGSTHDFDSTMLATLPRCLQRGLQERGEFDRLCISSTEEALSKKIGELEARVAEGEPEMAARSSQLEELRKAETGEDAAREVCQAALDEGKAAEMAALEASVAAESAAKSLRPALLAAERRLSELEQARAAFAAATVADFECLRAPGADGQEPSASAAADEELADEELAPVDAEQPVEKHVEAPTSSECPRLAEAAGA